MFKSLLVILSLTYTISPIDSFAQWSQEEASLADSYKSPTNSDRSRESISYMIWGLAQSKAMEKVELPNKKYPYLEKYSLPIVPGIQKPMPAYVGFHKNKDGSIRPAPLVVIVNGLFSDHKSDMVTVEKAFLSGNHILRIPTSLSLAYQNLLPSFKMGDFKSEAIIAYKILSKFLIPLKEKGVVTKTLYFGRSYGAFLGSHIALEDPEKAPLFDGPMYFLCPEAELGYAIDEFDRYFREQSRRMDGMLDKVRLFWSFSRYEKARKWKYLSHRNINMASALVSAGTHKELVDLLKATTKGFSKYLSRNYRSKYYFGFNDYIKDFAPELESLYRGNQGNFIETYKKARLKKKNQLKVLTADDDIYNAPHIWDEIEEEVMILKGGSHFGFLGSPWYNKFLNSIFK